MASAVIAAAPARRLRHLDFLVMSLYWVAIGFLWNSMGLLVVPYLVEHIVGKQLEGTATAFMENLGTLVAIVWQPLAGAISDRTRTRWGRRRPFIFAGTIGDAVFLTAIALSGAYLPLVAAYVLLQLASNTAQGPYQGLLPDLVPAEQKGTASGYYGASNLVGTLLGAGASGLILAHAGIGAVLASVAVSLVATMLITVTLVPDRGTSSEAMDPPLQLLARTFTAPLRVRPFLWLMASRLLILMGIVGIQTFLYFYFSNVFFHGDASKVGAAFSTTLGSAIVVAVLVSFPAARLSDRIGRRPLICASGLLGAVGTIVLVFSHYQWVPGALLEPLARAMGVPVLAAQASLVGLVIGLGLGTFFSVDWAFITDVIPAAEAGLFMGFSNIATAGSGLLARGLAGPVHDYFNAGPQILGLPGGYPVIFTIFFVWLVLGSLAIYRVPERRRSPST
ncbi:MAG TPA: MFS transporter [Candidatus Dormibacteraeota bacterium]